MGAHTAVLSPSSVCAAYKIPQAQRSHGPHLNRGNGSSRSMDKGTSFFHGQAVQLATRSSTTASNGGCAHQAAGARSVRCAQKVRVRDGAQEGPGQQGKVSRRTALLRGWGAALALGAIEAPAEARTRAEGREAVRKRLGKVKDSSETGSSEAEAEEAEPASPAGPDETVEARSPEPSSLAEAKVEPAAEGEKAEAVADTEPPSGVPEDVRSTDVETSPQTAEAPLEEGPAPKDTEGKLEEVEVVEVLDVVAEDAPELVEVKIEPAGELVEVAIEPQTGELPKEAVVLEGVEPAGQTGEQ